MSIKKENGLSIHITLSPEQKLNQAGTYTGLIRDAIDSAITANASDIHFEPTEEGYKIRLRICGILMTFYDFRKSKNNSIKPDILRNGITTTLKSVFNVQLGKQNIAQDGGVELPERGMSIRINKTPVTHGEKFVFRLFNKASTKKITDIGLSKVALNDVKQSLEKKSGLIIITGETGSGKTSTIYSMIEHIDRERLNVSTLEDPVERTIDGVNHTPITPSFSFSDGLRALMRQDPDVILIGEIRDEATAKLAVRAGSTGHLVISTMHTNTALNIPKVFEYYGADKLQLMNSLILGVNQRLIARLCQHCSLKGKLFKNSKLINKKGCQNCNGGIDGTRELIFEYFTANEIQGDTINLKQNIGTLALNLVKKGVIDENELLRQGNYFGTEPLPGQTG